jgi:hypothetical protein
LARDRVDVSLSPAARLVAAGAGLLLVAMVALLIAQLAILSDSREHIVAQDRKINRIVKGTQPVLGELQPVAEEARGALRQAEPFVRELRTEMIPLLRDLRGSQLTAAIDVTARPATSLDHEGRLVRLVDQGNELIDALRASEFIPRTLRAADLAPEAFRIAADVLEVQRRTLKVQVQTKAIQVRLLAIQEEALTHIRSIDRKTGGPAPATGAPAPVPGAR